MENNNIPIITIDYFEEVYIEHVINTLRISKDEFRAKLESIDSTSINKKADRFITTYLKNRTDKLTEDNWIAAKELYIYIGFVNSFKYISTRIRSSKFI